MTTEEISAAITETAAPVKKVAEGTSDTSDFVAITDDGLKKRVLKEGDGAAPVTGSKVHVHYVGTLWPSGEKFDSSRDRGDLFTFTLGQGQVIKGWDVGVATMKIGEVAELLCPADYAYGAHGSPPKIPGGATLKFEVELFDFDEPADSVAKKLELAAKNKDIGNDLFKQGQHADAIKAYVKALQFFEEVFSPSDEEQKEIDQVKFALHSNLAACYLKVNDARQAQSHCQDALHIKDDNPKVLFRLGQAQQKLGEFDAALKTLERAQQVAPEDAAIPREIQLVKRSQLAFKEKEKKLFGKLFA